MPTPPTFPGDFVWSPASATYPIRAAGNIPQSGDRRTATILPTLVLLVLCLWIAPSLYAQSERGIWPMPSPFPTAPAGVSAPTYPVPRLDWVLQAKKATEAAQKRAADINVIFDGDSITAGWQSKGKELWEKRILPLGAVDFGISMDQTQHVLWRLSQGQAAGLKPKLIVLMIGANNVELYPVKDVAAGIQAIVEKYREVCPDAVILLQGILPNGAEPTHNRRIKTKEINAIIAKLADGQKIVFVDFGEKFLQPDGAISAEIMPDFLHPSAKGYQIWADALQPFMDKYLPKIATP